MLTRALKLFALLLGIVAAMPTEGPSGTFCSYLELVSVTITFNPLTKTAFIASYYPGVGDFNNITCPMESYAYDPISNFITFPYLHSPLDCLGANLYLKNDTTLFLIFDGPRQRLYLAEMEAGRQLMHFTYDRCDGLAPSGHYCAAFRGPADIRFEFYPAQLKFHFAATIGSVPIVCLDVLYLYDPLRSLVAYLPNACFAKFLALYNAEGLRITYAGRDDQIVLWTPTQPSYVAQSCLAPYPKGEYCGFDNMGGKFSFSFNSRTMLDFLYKGIERTTGCNVKPWYFFAATKTVNVVAQDTCIHDAMASLGFFWFRLGYVAENDMITLDGSNGSFRLRGGTCSLDDAAEEEENTVVRLL